MEERELKAEDIPWGYPVCFNNECADNDRCMHYQARLLMPKNPLFGAAAPPPFLGGGGGRCFPGKRKGKKGNGAPRNFKITLPHQRGVAPRVGVPSFGGKGGRLSWRVHGGLFFPSKKKKEFWLFFPSLVGCVASGLFFL